MGGVYADGVYAPIDYKKAFYYYTKAAGQGNIYALNNLGLMYENGPYVERDPQKAVTYYTQAADGGLAFAQYCWPICILWLRRRTRHVKGLPSL